MNERPCARDQEFVERIIFAPEEVEPIGGAAYCYPGALVRRWIEGKLTAADLQRVRHWRDRVVQDGYFWATSGQAEVLGTVFTREDPPLIVVLYGRR